MTTLDRIRREHRAWIADNPKGTLGELHQRLLLAAQQCAEFGEAEIDWDDIPQPLSSELSQRGDDEQATTFDYRLGDLTELADSVAEAIEEHGADFRLGQPVWIMFDWPEYEDHFHFLSHAGVPRIYQRDGYDQRAGSDLPYFDDFGAVVRHFHVDGNHDTPVQISADILDQFGFGKRIIKLALAAA